MEKYNYLQSVKDDVREYINEHDIQVSNVDHEYLYDQLYDECFISDSVTGNASGSYTFNTWKAEEYLCHNMYLLQDACCEFGCDPQFDNAEWCDVTIRCYILGQEISEVIDEIQEE